MIKNKSLKEKFAKKIGRNLKFYRKDRCFTLRELARKTNYTFQHINLIEKGKTTPNTYVLYQIAATLAVPISNFYQEHEAESKVDDFGIPVSVLAQNEYLQLLKDFAVRNIHVEDIKNTVDALNSAYKNSR